MERHGIWKAQKSANPVKRKFQGLCLPFEKSEDSFIAIKSVILIRAVSYQLLISGNGGTVNSFLDLLVGLFIFYSVQVYQALAFLLEF